jgi:hypothetical protein
VSAPPSVPTLRASSSGEHLWIAVPAAPGNGEGVRIVHSVNGAVRDCGALDAMPDALVAGGARLWMVMPPLPGGGVSPVYSVRANYNQISDRWFSEPIGRFNVLPSIPAGGHLSGAAPSGQQLLALQGPAPFALLEQRGAGWSDLQLPARLPSGTMLHQWPAREGSGWTLVARDGADLRTWTVRSPEAGSEALEWSSALLPGSGADLALVVSGASRPTVLRHSGGGGEWSLAYARADGPLEIARIVAPELPWTVVGLGDSFALISVSEAGQVSAARIDSVEGTVAGPTPMSEAPSAAGDWLHLPLIGAVTIAALLAAFLVRPPVGDRMPALPAGWEPMDSWRRALGLMIDMIPGALVSMAVTGCAPQELLAMPAWTAATAKVIPSSIMLGFTIVWCLAWEVSIASTPGKLATGRSRIVRIDRLSPREQAARASAPAAEWPAPAATRMRRAARAILKGVVLFAPALAFLAFVHPLQMGLPDVMTDTAVARRRR